MTTSLLVGGMTHRLTEGMFRVLRRHTDTKGILEMHRTDASCDIGKQEEAWQFAKNAFVRFQITNFRI